MADLTVAGAADSDAVITIAADEGNRAIIEGMQFSYSGAPTGGSLRVESDNTLWQLDITAGGVGSVSFPVTTDKFNKLQGGLRGTLDKELVITLAAGGGVLVGKLNVQTRDE